MYANLKVTVGESVYPAYEVQVRDNVMTVFLDANEGGSDYVPAGEVDVDLDELWPPRTVTITADF